MLSKSGIYCFGPTVFRLDQAIYRASSLEVFGDTFISGFSKAYAFLKLAFPVLLILAYRRGYFSADSFNSISQVVKENKWRTPVIAWTSSQPWALLSLIAFTTPFVCRGIARWRNAGYQRFVDTLDAARRGDKDAAAVLARSDFQFNSFVPSAFQAQYRSPHASERFNGFQLANPLYWFSSFAANVIGVRLVYPGLIFGGMTADMRHQSLARLQAQKGAQRLMIKTSGDERVDVLVADNRNKTAFGNILVVCSEGNAGFYEYGQPITPLELGYSVVGWQHAGFGGSSGKPFPATERRFIDAVMQFATAPKEQGGLGFPVERIILSGWSIGGYPAAYAATLYPRIRYLFLDATFDHIKPVALSKMPDWLYPICKLLMEHQFNLNVAEVLERYQGPLLLLRRQHDEIISTDPYHKLESNRGNYLLAHLLKHRFPQLFKGAEAEADAALHSIFNETSPQLNAWLFAHRERTRSIEEKLEPLVSARNFPVNVPDFEPTPEARLDFFRVLMYKYMRDFDSPHNNPLAHEHFVPAWMASPPNV